MTLGRRAKVQVSKVLHLKKAPIPKVPPKALLEAEEADQLEAEEIVEDSEVVDHDEADEADFGNFAIQWNPEKTHFTSKQISSGDLYKFYGWFRKTRSAGNEAYAIDIFAKQSEADWAVDSIGYFGPDPRKKTTSMNADICAAINKWFFTKLDGSFKTIDILKKQAEHPTIHVTQIGTIDSIILKLKECRDTAIRCGGHRLVQLTGDKEGDTPMNITVNVTAQAIELEGKVPTLEMGAMSDVVIAMSAGAKPLAIRGNRPTRTINIPDKGNVAALVERLKVADKGEQRKIRAVLRKMGHKGGGRSFSKLD